MGQNLTGQTVSSTYQDLVQISGSVFTDGLGNNITSVDVTASYATTALSSSYALTASFALNGGGSTVDTGSLLTTASISDATITFTKGDASTFNLTVNNVAYAGTAGFADQSGTSGFASQAGTAGFADQAGTSGFATSASWADQSGTSGYSVESGTSGFATSASYATRAATVDVASNSTNDPYRIIIGETGTGKLLNSDAQLTYNPSTNILGGGATFEGTASYALTASYLEGGVDAFPYTGSASITGSLHVTGSQTGILADSEEYKIFTKQVSNSTSPNILIGAQDPSMNGLNTPAGINNVVIGTGEFTSDIKGLGPGADDSNTLIGGWGGVIWNGSYNTLLGGGQNVMSYQGDVQVPASTQYNVIVGGTGATIAKGSYNVIVGGNSNSILSGSESTPSYNGIFVGQTANVTGTDNAQIIGGVTNTITNGDRSIILGGSTNNITFGAGTTANSAVVGGSTNTVTHSRSVVVGGQNLSTTQNDEVVVPNLRAVGNVVVTGSVTATTGFTGSLEGAASLLDISTGITSDPYNVIFGEIGTAKTLRGESGFTYNPGTDTLKVVNTEIATKLTISGSAVGEVNTLSITSQTASLDCSAGNFFTLQLVGGTDTHINPSNIQAGQTLNIRVNTTGSGTVSFPSSVLQASGSSYVPTTTTGVDIITLISYDTSNLYLSNIKNFI